MKKQTNKVLVSLANMRPRRFSRALCVGLCFCALAFAVRSAHAALCKWSLEEVVVVTAQFTEEQKKDLYELIDELMKSVAPKPPQIDAIEKLIEGIGGDIVEVVIIYSCRDDITGDTYRKKVELDHTEDFHWAAKMMKDEEAAKKRKDLIEKFRPKGTCCKATPTPSPSPSPSPSPPTPTPTPTSTPSRRVTYTGQTPTPTPQGHGMVPRQPRRPGKTGETCAVLIATGKIKVETLGTGETIGHIADLKIQNLTDQPLTCAIAPMILESGSARNQHYACPLGKTVALNPHQTKTVPMNGVCLNRNKPPVGKGVSGDLIMNEANPAAPQNPNSHIAANQAGDLLRICTSKYDAADKLQKDGALRALPYKEKQKQKDIVVQWSTWCDPRIAQITGAPPATKEDLRKVVYKQAEAKGPVSPETKKKLDQGIDTIFEKVELTTAKAKDLEKPSEEAAPVAETAVEQAPAGGVPVAAPRRGTLHPCEPQLKLGEIEGPDELEVGQEKDYSVEVTSDCGNCYETDGEGGIIAGTFKACEKKLTYKWTYTPHQIGVAGDIEYKGGIEDTKSKIKGKKAGEVLLSFKVWLECEKQSDRCYKMTSDEKKKVITVVPKK